jgi:hypothetical protein
MASAAWSSCAANAAFFVCVIIYIYKHPPPPLPTAMQYIGGAFVLVRSTNRCRVPRETKARKALLTAAIWPIKCCTAPTLCMKSTFLSTTGKFDS